MTVQVYTEFKNYLLGFNYSTLFITLPPTAVINFVRMHQIVIVEINDQSLLAAIEQTNTDNICRQFLRASPKSSKLDVMYISSGVTVQYGCTILVSSF